jgi:3-oxoacyl-[acyl-carrier protein] reductase
VLTGPAKAALTAEALEDSLRELPLTRLGEPADLAAAIAFLLSADAAWITGQVISVNGGFAFRE